MNNCVGKILLGLFAMLPVLAAGGCASSTSPSTVHSGGTSGGHRATGGALLLRCHFRFASVITKAMTAPKTNWLYSSRLMSASCA